MRFNNNTNIPNKVVQNVVNHLDEYQPLYSFTDAQGYNSVIYHVDVKDFPTIIVTVIGKNCNITTIGNTKYFNINKDKKVNKK